MQASEWAEHWIKNNEESIYGLDNDLWHAIELLCMADSPTTDRPYLFGEIDFFEELEKIDRL